MKKKIIQSYWRTREHKLPIWKQNNDDKKLGGDTKTSGKPMKGRKITMKELKERLDRDYIKEDASKGWY